MSEPLTDEELALVLNTMHGSRIGPLVLRMAAELRAHRARRKRLGDAIENYHKIKEKTAHMNSVAYMIEGADAVLEAKCDVADAVMAPVQEAKQ